MSKKGSVEESPAFIARRDQAKTELENSYLAFQYTMSWYLQHFGQEEVKATKRKLKLQRIGLFLAWLVLFVQVLLFRWVVSDQFSIPILLHAILGVISGFAGGVVLLRLVKTAHYLE